MNEIVMSHPIRKVIYPKLTLQRQGRESCLRLADHIDRLKLDGELQLGGLKWSLPTALSGAGCSCIDIAFDTWHQSHRSLHLHNADSESPPAIEPFQALPCIVTLWRIAS